MILSLFFLLVSVVAAVILFFTSLAHRRNNNTVGVYIDSTIGALNVVNAVRILGLF